MNGYKGLMTRPSNKASAGWIRWLPRILGIPIGLFTLGEFLSSLGYLGDLSAVSYLMNAGALLVCAGCVVGWFKELAGSLLILCGTAIFGAVTVVHHQRLPLLLVMISPALVGFLYLYVYLARKKRARPGRLDPSV